MTTAAAFAVGLVGLAGSLVVLVRVPRPSKPAPALDDSGSAAMEMVLVLPLFLTTIMVVVQCTHLMFAAILVEHAAFCVSRSASVQVPLSLDGEPANQLFSPDRSPKLSRLNAQANTLMSPVNRRLNLGGLMPFAANVLPGFDVTLSQYLASDFVPDSSELFGLKTVVWDLVLRTSSGRFAQSRLAGPWAKWFLNLGVARVEIRRAGEATTGEYSDEPRRFGDSEILDVRVVYEYPLDVPAGGNLMGPLIGYVPDFGPDWFSRYIARLLGFKYRTDIVSTYRVVSWGQSEAPATP